MPSNEAELEALRRKLDTVLDRIAIRVARIDKIDEELPKLRDDKKAAARHTEEREQLVYEIKQLVGQRRSLKENVGAAEGLVTKLRKKIKRKRREIRNAISPKVVDLAFDKTAVKPLYRQGTIYGSVGHYTAGPLDDDGDDESFDLWRAYDRAHKGQQWACLGYNIGITRLGTIVRLRGIEYVGAHTLGYNENRVGISVHGTTGHTWTKAQLRGLRKALKLYGLADKPVIGHKEAPGQSTACPGLFLNGFHTKGKTA